MNPSALDPAESSPLMGTLSVPGVRGARVPGGTSSLQRSPQDSGQGGPQR